MNNSYHADALSWEDHTTVHFEAENKEAARRRAASIIDLDLPEGFDFVRLWGKGKLLWTADEGWLPDHEAF